MMSSLLLEKCYSNTKNFAPFLIENLLIFADDDDQKVAQFSRNALNCLMKNHILFHRIKNEIFDIFNRCLTRLPRILYNGLDSEQLEDLKLLNGVILFIKIVDKNLSALLENHLMLEKLIGVLLICSELDAANNDLLFGNYDVISIEDHYYHLKKPWCKFKNLLDSAVVLKFKHVCENIAKSEIAYSVINHLVENLSCLEHLVLLNEILSGNLKEENHRFVVCSILEEFLNDDSYWKMETNVESLTFQSSDKVINSDK